MVKKNISDLKPEELKGKVVFVRADLNVPQVSGGGGRQPRDYRCSPVGFACLLLLPVAHPMIQASLHARHVGAEALPNANRRLAAATAH